MIASLVLVEGEKVIEENLLIPLTNVEEVLVGSADGFGHLVHFVANSTSDLGGARLGWSPQRHRCADAGYEAVGLTRNMHSRLISSTHHRMNR